jgi:heme/copper-type cytochrome/quinol oxidase subunit 2
MAVGGWLRGVITAVVFVTVLYILWHLARQRQGQDDSAPFKPKASHVKVNDASETTVPVPTSEAGKTETAK